MKAKYLSVTDKKNLKALSQTNNKDEIISILESLIYREDFTLQVFWEYRDYIFAFSDQELKQNPIIACGRIQLEMCAGKLDNAMRIIELLDKDSEYYTLSLITLPNIPFETILDGVKKIIDNNWHPYNFFLTLGRPTVRNGYWDLTKYHDYIVSNEESLIKVLNVLYPTNARNIYDMLIAEGMYQRDECYEALVKVVGLIPFLKEKKDFRLLFTSIALETYVLVVNGNATSTEPFMESLGEIFMKNGMGEYLPNMKALDVWAAMYEGDYKRINKWLQNDAPDENKPFCLFELFGYMIKIRAYLIQDKHYKIADMTATLLPILESNCRTMDVCELCLLNAMSNYAEGRNNEALRYMERVIDLAQKYRYDRLVADEGKRAYDLLCFYIKEKGNSEYVENLKKLAKKVMIIHPYYLRTHTLLEVSLTKAEIEVLKLIGDYKSNDEISKILGIAVTTVKKHCQNAYKKLEVKNRYKAVSKAIELGLL